MTGQFATQRIAPALAIAAGQIGSNPTELVARGRRRDLARQRFALMLALRRRTSWSLTAIARRLGRNDYTTVIYGLAKAKLIEAEDAEFADLVAQLEAVL